MKYNHVIVGGTFDHFHKGHKSLLDLAFQIGKKVTIGIAQPNLYKDKLLSSVIEEYEARKKSVVDYLNKDNLLIRSSLISITDIYGTSDEDVTIEAIIVSDETRENAIKVNELRKKIGIKPLEIIILPFVKGTDGKIISSERIRLGEIDRDGNPYIDFFVKEKLVLPEYLKEDLRKPIGRVITGGEDDQERVVKQIIQVIKNLKPILIVTVGDYVTAILIKGGIIPNIQIVDFKTRREDISYEHRQLLITKNIKKHINIHGTINRQSVLAFKGAIDMFFRTKQQQQLTIEGEEDLIALPAVLLAPLKSIVLYGQFELGTIIIEVTEEKKKQVMQILNCFN